jgi:hypothetical protein
MKQMITFNLSHMAFETVMVFNQQQSDYIES